METAPASCFFRRDRLPAVPDVLALISLTAGRPNDAGYA